MFSQIIAKRRAVTKVDVEVDVEVESEGTVREVLTTKQLKKKSTNYCVCLYSSKCNFKCISIYVGKDLGTNYEN